MAVANPRLRLRRWILATGLAVIAAFVGSSVYDAWRLYDQLSESTERELTNLARALSEEAERSLQAVDLLLTDTQLWYESTGRSLTGLEIERALASRGSATPYVSMLTVVDAEGDQRFRSRTRSVPLAHVADRPYFIAQRDGLAKGLFINPPIVTRTDKKISLVVSRRLEHNGEFDGVVTASVTLDDLREVYDAIRLGEHSALLLTFDDGRVVVRHPVHEVIKPDTMFPEVVALKDQPVARRISPVDGREKFIVAASVADRPLILAVTRDVQGALQPWRDDLVTVAVRTVLLTGVVLLTMAVLIRQLTRLEAAEAERAQLEAQLRQAQQLEALGTLAGGIAHDFNNILGAILGHGEMAQREAPEGSALRRHVDRVMQGGERARLLVRRILDFSRGSVRERVLVPLKAVAEEALALLAPGLPATVRLDASLRANRVAVRGDPTQVHQLVSNLCANAVAAMPDGGVLTVGLECAELEQALRLSHGSVGPGVFACLAIADTGTGIAPEVYARMFDPFFSTKRVGEGTGLGLSVVHSIVAEMGGALDVRTASGQGSRFSIWLPIAGDAGEAETGARPADAEMPRGQGQTVMLVDDEAALLESAEEMLAQLGYEPVGFCSAAGALQAFRDDPQRFDAVLTDETMPELAGTALAAELQALRPGLPVIVMSGYGGPPLEARVKAAGARALLSKPLAMRDIAEALARHGFS
ncbi:ATP-binding protein [Paucibacter sp. R3-3]|uniref:histidine kinase n=1 Tax=Roseateles agri TaxID=3098619 RepID=A0ABU5DCA9_9BURK|nr:ATP-binding protein [Paucibacter sp. R3-3]MDY0743769.1 ATP-binding protein [Paucibacter sp. R3-3]